MAQTLITTNKAGVDTGAKPVESHPFRAKIGEVTHNLALNECLKNEGMLTITHVASGNAIGHFIKANTKLGHKKNVDAAHVRLDELVARHGARRMNDVISQSPPIS
jgi:hypothetical protein